MSLLAEATAKEKPGLSIDDTSELTREQLISIRDSRDYYTLLGLTDEATDTEIQGKYKSNALRLHPDRHAKSEFQDLFKEAFEALTNAKKTLLDPVARKTYDFQRGKRNVKGKWSFGSLKARREIVDEDYRKVEYEIHLEAQLKRANLYNEIHESDKIIAFGHVLAEFRTKVLSQMHDNNWTPAEAAVYAQELIGKSVDAKEVEEWAEMERTGKTFEEGMSRQQLEAESGLVDTKGHFRGYSSFDEFKSVFGSKEMLSKDPMLGDNTQEDIVSGASDELRNTILRVREENRLEKLAAEESIQAERKKEELARKRSRDEAEASIIQKISAKVQRIDNSGFVQISSPVKRIPQPTATGVASLLQSHRQSNSDSEDEGGDSDTGFDLDY